MPLHRGISELRSTRPKLVPFLATRCLYWGYIWLKVSLTQSWPYAVPLLANRCFLHGGIFELRSTRPKIVPFLATRCFYQGLHLTEGQPDPKADQMSSWPHKADQMSTWPDVVLLFTTGCLYLGGTSDWRSAWPKGGQNVKLTWQYQSWPPDAPTRGYIWLTWSHTVGKPLSLISLLNYRLTTD